MYVLQNIALVNLKSLQRILVYQTKYGVGKGLDKPWFILLLFWCLMPLSSLLASSLRTVFFYRQKNNSIKKHKQMVASAKWICHSYISVVVGMLSHWEELASPFLRSACTCRLHIFVARLLSHWRLPHNLFVAHYIFANMQLKMLLHMYNKVRKCRREDQRT